MQSIITKRHYKSSRMSATAPAGRIYIPYDDHMTLEKNHILAAKVLCNKMNWKNAKIIGGNNKDSSMVWVFSDEHSTFFTI